MDLKEYREKISHLEVNEQVLRDLYLRDLALGKLQGSMTGYATLDKPWLKWYDEDSIQSEMPSKKIYDCIFENNKDHLDEIALEYYGTNITYGELFENIDHYAKAFRQRGIKEQDIVTVGMLTTPEAIYTMLALNKIGAISSMIDPRSNVKGLHKYLVDNASDLVIVTDLFKGKFKQAIENTPVKQVIVSPVLASHPLFYKPTKKLKSKKDIEKKLKEKFVNLSDFIQDGENYNGILASDYVEDSPAIIVHSGGTTGFPKAVVMSDKKILASVYQCLNSGIKFKRGESWLGIMPLFIIYGASTGTLLPLVKGIKIHLVSLFDPKGLPNLLYKKKPTHMTLAPSHFEHLVGNKKLEHEDLSYIVAPTVGGDTMNIELEKKANEWLKEHNCEYKIVKGYGSSETCSAVTVCVSNECNKLGSVGIPLPKTTISIFDIETGEELPIGEKGEICVLGPTNMIKYLNSPEDTELVLKKHDDGKTWVHTGDYGYFDEDGMLFVTDRIKRMIIDFGGFKILPSYVESIINRHPNVEKSIVFGVPDKEHVQGDVPVACVVLKDKKEQSIRDIKELCRKELKDSTSMPSQFYVVNEIPCIQTNGKEDINALKEMIRKQEEKPHTLVKKVKK